MNRTRTRLLYVHSSSDLWGSDRCLYQMLERIDRNVYEPSVVLPWPGPLSERIESLGIEVTYPPCMGILRRFRNPLQCIAYFGKLFVEVIWLIFFLRKHRVSIVHVNTSSLIGPLIAARLCRVSAICHLREIRLSPRFVGRALVTTINLLSDQVITISQAVTEFARSGWIQPHSLAIVHDGVENEANDGASSPLPCSLELPPNSVVVSIIGRITYWKGTHVFLEAAQRVLQEIPCAYCLVVGASDTAQAERYQQELRESVKTRGLSDRVIFTGFVADIRPIMARTDILALPSIYPEPFGMVVIEAMQQGKPVIATRHGGPLDIIEDGREGFLVAPNDPQQLAEKIATLIADPLLRTEMGARARQRVASRFHIAETIHSIHKVYEKVGV